MTSEARIERLLAATQREFRREYEILIQQVRNSLTVAEIAGVLETEGAGALLSRYVVDPRRFGQAWAAAYTRAAEAAGREVGSSFLFDSLSPTVVQQLQAQRARVVQEALVRQAQTVRDVIADGVRRGRVARDVAQSLRDTAGLSPRLARTLLSFQEGLVGVAPRRAQDLVSTYRGRLVTYQSSLLSSTESLRAVNMGTVAAWRQAIEEGLVAPEDLSQTWKTQGDHSVRSSHTPMNGQRRSWGEPFKSGAGALLKHPGDPDAPASEVANCRCFLVVELDSPK